MAHQTLQIPFVGAMNLDDPKENIPKGMHSDARNMIFRGEPGNMRGENLSGARFIPNNLLPGGGNCCIGGTYDAVNDDVYFCNWNSLGNHAIYKLNIKSEQVTTLNIDAAVLGFDPAKPIHSITILYGDEVTGNLLFWVSSTGIPTRINIKQALSGTYGTYRQQYLNLIKRPPNTPAAASYEVTTNTINNERKQLFKFKYWFEYEIYDKSVTSAQSVMPVPLDVLDVTVDSDPTKNSGVGIIIQTGAPNVKKIHLGACYNNGTTFSDFFEIDLLDKAAMSIPDDDIYLYHFYNDKAYINIDPTFSDLEFDRVPPQVNSQELMNGNTPIYANIVEGFDLLSSLGNSNASPFYQTVRRTAPPNVMLAAQGGESVGTAGDPIHIIVNGVVRINDTYNIGTTGYTFTYVAAAGTTTDVINGIKALAITAGFTIVSSDANNLIIQKPGERLLRQQLALNGNALGANDVTPCDNWWSKEAYALVYFDEEGRTNGAMLTQGFTIETVGYSESAGFAQVPYTAFSIYHQPPVWAKYMHILRSNNLSKAKWIQWISDRTFKDSVASDDGKFYAYISIENLNQYITDNPSSKFLAYDFATGDRIRFIKNYINPGNPSFIYANRDYEIQGQLIDPVINGTQEQGQFIKIYLPPTDSFFDFGTPPDGFGGILNFNNYFIELYTPALPATENLNQYFEFGQEYVIIDAFTATRRHAGMLQNQSVNYSVPATYKLDQGLAYARYRTINASDELKYTLVEGDVGELDFVPMILSQSFNAPGWVAQSVVASHLSGNLKDSNNWNINVTDGQAYTFRIKGNITVKTLNDSSDSFGYAVDVVDGGSTINTKDLFTIYSPRANQQTTFTVDTTVTMPAGFIKLFIIGRSGPSFDAVVHTVSGELEITEVGKTFTQLIIDPNFSDSFPSAVNSNGREWVFDPNAKETRFPTGARYGLDFQKDTNINDSNRFYPDNTDSYNAAYGGVTRLKIHGQELRVFQYRRTGMVGVYKKWITQADGSAQLITSEQIITPNNIEYYDGEFGIGNQSMSLASASFVDYFPDPVRGYLLRLSKDGITPISDLYKAQSWSGTVLPPYLLNVPYQYGGYAKILGAFNRPSGRPPEYVCFAQPGHSMYSIYGIYGIYDIGGEALVFGEKYNTFTSKYDINPDFVLIAENKMICWHSGNIYFMDDTVNTNKFFGTQYDSVVEVVSNEPKDVKKDFTTLSLNAPYPQYGIDIPGWTAPNVGDVETSLGQYSNLVTEDFDYDQGFWHAAIQGEWDNVYGVINANEMKGLWMKVRLSNAGNKFTFISSLYMNYLISQKNF